MAAAFDTDEFYRQSCDAGFVKLDDVARNIVWTSPTAWGEMEITINLSKPEKDPREIAAASRADVGGRDGARSYVDPATGRQRACPLCVEQADIDCGYARPMRLGGEKWALWYSPYVYFDEHCIAMSWDHRPMRIDRKAFGCLFDAVDALPQYFFGSNADLPGVGGSILAHEHFQGGRHVFPMQLAPLSERFELKRFPGVEAGIVRWPVSIVRLSGADRDELVEAACSISDVWRSYDDADVGIISGNGPECEPHHTVTPMLRRVSGRYQFDIALRSNIASDEHPLGVFHPHEDLHHIKRENIGLIEVMGLAILPPRVRDVMVDRNLCREDVGELFARVLEDVGVFKWDEQGREALRRFIAALGSRV